MNRRTIAALGLFLAVGLARCSPQAGGAGDSASPPLDGGAPDSASADLREGGLDITMTPDSGARAPGTFELEVGARRLRLHLLDDHTVRVRYLRKGEAAHPERGWTTALDGGMPTAKLPFTEEKEAYSLRTAAMEIRVRKADASLEFRDLKGAVISADRAGKASPYGLTLSRDMPADEHYFGLGEKSGPLDKRGYRLEMWNTDPLYPKRDYTTTKDPLYQAIPFLIGLRKGRAWGLYLNNTYRSVFDLGKTTTGQLSVTAGGGELDYFFIYGPSVARVVRGFSGVTGRAPLPALWSLGYHQSRWSYSPEAKLRKIASELRKRSIPCDGLWLDIDYMDGYRSFTWDKTRFADPKKLMSDLATDGFKVTAIIDPGIKDDPGGSYAAYNQGVAGKHFVPLPSGALYKGKVWPGAAVFPDFSRPATRAWWAGLVKAFVSVGLRGVWIDMNEPATWQPGGFPLDTVWDGEGKKTDHRETHNVFASLMARATRDGVQQALPGKRPFVLTRAGFAGIQRHAAVWTGDMNSEWSHLAMAVPMMLNMGLSGVSLVGSDVGGYSGSPSAELFARWIQLGALSPFFRTHVETGTPDQEPWSFGAKVEAISKEYISWRYRMLPYFYALARRASVDGAPMLRPLLYEFPQDEAGVTVGDQLLLGSWLMAAPVSWGKALARRVYLPAGTWFDYHDGHLFEGGKAVSVGAPMERLPMLVRQGAILPSWDVVQYVGQKKPSVLYLDLYPVNGAPTTAQTLYADDGESLAYSKQAAYREVTASLSADAKGATLSLGAPKGSYPAQEAQLHLRFRGVRAAPTAAQRGGAALTKRASAAEVEAKGGWFHDAAAAVVHARVPMPAGAETVRCEYDVTATAPRKVQLTLDVTLPAGTAAGDVYLSSNLHRWSAKGIKLARKSATRAVGTVTLEEGTVLEYKYNRGAWASGEKASGCGEVKNRLLLVKDPGGGKAQVSDTVVGWADACP